MDITASQYFLEKGLYYIKNFEFDQGDHRNKFLLVLAIDNGDMIYCLTTSQHIEKLPTSSRRHGCRKVKFNQFYYIPPTVSLGSDGFKFDTKTVIFFQNNIHKKNLTDLDKYSNIDRCEFKTQLIDTEYKEILGCILSSDHCPIGCQGTLNKRLTG